MADLAPIACLADITRRWSAETPDKTALIDGERTVSYAEFDASANRIANALVDSGLAVDSHVGYLGENSARFFEIWMGASKAACALVPLNWRSSPVELVALVDDAELALLFVGPEFEELTTQALASAATRPMVVFEAGLDDWLRDADEADPMVPVEPGSTALLAYTSGTTAAPKGVAVTHAAFLAWFEVASDEPAASWAADDVGLMVMPNFHLAGTWVSLPALHAGATLAVLPVFAPQPFLEAVRTRGVTVTCLVPTAIQLLLQHISKSNTDGLSSLRRMMYAGSPIGAETLRTTIEVFDCDLVQFYGTTETFIITLLRPDQHRPDEPDLLTSCGRPMPGVQVRVVDNAGRDLEDGTAGEVLVCSPWMFAGYWNKPDATSSVFADGWYRTGDVGMLDTRGNLRLVDRLKDMIVTGGENVYSAEVERALSSYHGVAGAAVVGMPDEKWGERVVAYVVPTADATLDIEDLIVHCRNKIAGYKVPKQIHLVDGLPLTASGKVRKEFLRTQLPTPATSLADRVGRALT